MRTPLFENHVALDARMVDFAGWQMPVQYAGILDEHRHTRTTVSLFDTCHMSEFFIRGPGAQSALRETLACRVERMAVGRCRYGFLLNAAGGVIDDLICYRSGPEEFMVVGNAGRREADAEALAERIGTQADFADVSDETGKIDLQGPAGLGARDTLRLEMGYPLYGHELDESTTPVEAGLEWALPAHDEYVGAGTVRRLREEGPERRLVGLRFSGRQAAREGARLLAAENEVGTVTSGSFGPSLGSAVALGYAAAAVAKPGQRLEAEARGRRLSGRVYTLG